jgi:hypothetical protein
MAVLVLALDYFRVAGPVMGGLLALAAYNWGGWKPSSRPDALGMARPPRVVQRQTLNVRTAARRCTHPLRRARGLSFWLGAWRR